MRDQIGFLLGKCIFAIFIQNPVTCTLCILKNVCWSFLCTAFFRSDFSSSCHRYSVCSILHSLCWKSWS